jgi:hypothetical protein
LRVIPERAWACRSARQQGSDCRFDTIESILYTFQYALSSEALTYLAVWHLGIKHISTA